MVELDLKKDQRFARFLAPHEVVRGVPFVLGFKITNIGTDDFPGGNIGTVRVTQPGSLGGMAKEAVWGPKEASISKLPPEASVNATGIPISLEWEGLGQVAFSITSADGLETLLFQNRSYQLQGNWLNFLYSVGREGVLIIETLERIERQLGSLRKEGSTN
jgi:hypothetical protein